MSVAVLGGVFEPSASRSRLPGEGARTQLGADNLLVLVAARPGHKGVVADAPTLSGSPSLPSALGEVRLDDHA